MFIRLVTIKWFNVFTVICCSITFIVILVDIFNCAFYLFVNNVIWEVIVNESLFNVFKFGVQDYFGGGYKFGMWEFIKINKTKIKQN